MVCEDDDEDAPVFDEVRGRLASDEEVVGLLLEGVDGVPAEEPLVAEALFLSSNAAYSEYGEEFELDWWWW